MPQSLANVLLHVVFSTKNRAPFLKPPELREQLQGYIVGTLRDIECPSLIVRSVEDHLHCLLSLSRTMSIAKLVETMKVESSSWVKRQAPHLDDFYWQAGYRVLGQPVKCRTGQAVHRESGGTPPQDFVSR